ncbi:hypothetical protein T02_7681 [Trichinella nativa]|uniref:Uncharacterized protein n=1 Tax=Trichinella nativa TaxID=6335 RepID=A0A0V1KJE5_9BILA|nr:hypothetical protein T02_7681 [Trichinella nativa]
MNRSFCTYGDNTDAISENLSFENFFEKKIHKPARKQAVKKQNLKFNCNELHFLQGCFSIRLGIMYEVM